MSVVMTWLAKRAEDGEWKVALALGLKAAWMLDQHRCLMTWDDDHLLVIPVNLSLPIGPLRCIYFIFPAASGDDEGQEIIA